ncbi:MAG: hypothetical protein HY909_16380 [Deltaproteobacteria bacterium]|nr:hypothetical protein [Deltaproteobacteria bacterium]
MDTDDPPEEAPIASRSWGLTLASLLAAALGFFGTQSGVGTLEQVRAPALPQLPTEMANNPYSVAAVRAAWEFARGHPRSLAAFGAANLVLSGFLFLASMRVLLKPDRAGPLWRQALAANVALGLASLVVERAWTPAREALLRASLGALHAPMPPPMTPHGAARVAVFLQQLGLGLSLALLAFLWWYARRPGTRERVG